MKTILRFFCAAAFVWTFAIGVAAVAGVRFCLSMVLPSKTETTEQVVQAPANDDFPAGPSLVDMQPEIFDARGGVYYPQTIDTPKAFADLLYLEIETREYWQEEGRFLSKPIVPIGYLRVGKEFKFRSVTISDRVITFETLEINGVNYKFVGYFPKYREIENCNCDYPPDLKGKLIKLENGKMIAATQVDFYGGLDRPRYLRR
ncbi:MAG: hypothetical protein DMF62_11615 [Acidobacteria bacterium]|nr:MAG: hypothetical protein DMF62_11615 [Acidobacteriota bacterium]